MNARARKLTQAKQGLSSNSKPYTAFNPSPIGQSERSEAPCVRGDPVVIGPTPDGRVPEPGLTKGSDDMQRRLECNWIQNEIARQTAIAATAATAAMTPSTIIGFQNAAQDSIAALNQRAQMIQCRAEPVASN